MDFIREFWEFVRKRKIYWLLPLLLILMLLGGLIALAGGSALAPFIYAVF